MMKKSVSDNPQIVFGITGASGSIYAKTALEYLSVFCRLHIIVTDNGRSVFKHECGVDFNAFIASLYGSNEVAEIQLYDNNDMFAPVASGSFETDGMIIMPASMATVAKIASGISDTLLTRAADVCLKERRRLVLCPRETPYSTLHLRNMTSLSELGAIIFSLSPSFYSAPSSMEDLVKNVAGRAMMTFGLNNPLYEPWVGQKLYRADQS